MKKLPNMVISLLFTKKNILVTSTLIANYVDFISGNSKVSKMAVVVLVLATLQAQGLNFINKGQNNTAAPATVADPSHCNSTDMQCQLIQQNPIMQLIYLLRFRSP